MEKNFFEYVIDTVLGVDNKNLWELFCGKGRSCRANIRPLFFVEFCDEFRFSNKLNGFIVDIHIFNIRGGRYYE